MCSRKRLLWQRLESFHFQAPEPRSKLQETNLISYKSRSLKKNDLSERMVEMYVELPFLNTTYSHSVELKYINIDLFSDGFRYVFKTSWWIVSSCRVHPNGGNMKIAEIWQVHAVLRPQDFFLLWHFLFHLFFVCVGMIEINRLTSTFLNIQLESDSLSRVSSQCVIGVSSLSCCGLIETQCAWKWCDKLSYSITDCRVFLVQILFFSLFYLSWKLLKI